MRRSFQVAIYSSRSNHPDGIAAMQSHLADYYEQLGWPDPDVAAEKLLQWPTAKPPAMVTIDDRAIQFTGKWPAIEDLKAFKTWQQ